MSDCTKSEPARRKAVKFDFFDRLVIEVTFDQNEMDTYVAASGVTTLLPCSLVTEFPMP